MYTVSSLAKASGTSVDTVRYYSRLGLLPERGRTAGGHRYFDESAIERLQFIRGAQWFELRLDEIRELLEARDKGRCPCELTKSLLAQKVAAIDSERERLGHIRSVLGGLLTNPGDPGFNEAALSAGATCHTSRFREREYLIRRRAAVEGRLRDLSG